MQNNQLHRSMNKNHAILRQSKQCSKYLISPYANAVSDSKEKIEPKCSNKEPKSKIPSALNSPRAEKKPSSLKTNGRGKSSGSITKDIQKGSKENTSKAKHIQLRRNSRNQMDYYRPSPILSRSEEEFVSSRQERRSCLEVLEKKQMDFVIEEEFSSNLLSFKKQASFNKIEKKRPTLIRMGKPLRLRQEELDQDAENELNQVIIVNPAIEQELFKKYLEADKQTFEFEQHVMLGNYAKSESGSSLLNNARIISDVVSPAKPTKVQAKLQIITKDSLNTMAGLTTNSTSRNKVSLGAISGIYEKENASRLDLIEWAKERESDVNISKGSKSMKHSKKNSCSKELRAVKEIPKHIKPKESNQTLAEALSYALSHLKKDKTQMKKSIKKRNSSVQYVANH